MAVTDEVDPGDLLAPPIDHHRRRATHLYGLIICGAVLATASSQFRLGRVAFILVSTLMIYWVAETYVHLLATRALAKRPLTRAEAWTITLDGWPLVTASAAPLILLSIEALLQIETSRALEVVLTFNALLLFVVGWQISWDGGLRGKRLVLSATLAGLLGMAMVGLKVHLH